MTNEITCLLRKRLRLAAVIILFATGMYYIRNVWETPFGEGAFSFGMILHASVVLAVAGLGAIFWSRLALPMPKLRLLEVALFGVMAAFFAWLQYDFSGRSISWRPAIVEQQPTFYRLLAASNGLRWFVLIVIYGVFIPNTWRRCAVVVGTITVVAIALTIGTGVVNPEARTYAWTALPDMCCLMLTASAIAVFGTYKIRELHEKAFEAQQIGQYRLRRKLGAGGMGEVYLAEHVMLRRPCAIKLIRPEQAGDPKTLARFEREVQSTAALTHWNTVEIFDYGHAEDGTFYYVMEYLPGMNLEDLVEKYGPMPPERVVHFVRQVCGALREAHGVGLIHRDIKPSNIFASERGKVYDVAKLLDFGLVKSFGLESDNIKLTQEGSLAGSPAYMSPEQAAGRQLDARSDIYNLGAVAYFLMTGQLLFDRESPLQMLHAHAYETIAPLPEFQEDVPADLQKIILRCLEKEPTRRYQDADSLEKALAQCSSADGWSPEMAEEWWREHAGGSAIPAEHDADQRHIRTVLAPR